MGEGGPSFFGVGRDKGAKGTFIPSLTHSIVSFSEYPFFLAQSWPKGTLHMKLLLLFIVVLLFVGCNAESPPAPGRPGRGGAGAQDVSRAHELTSGAGRAALERQASICDTHAATGKDHRSGLLAKVLLVVIFNHHEYLATSVQTLVDLWGGVFPNITYCSDTKVPNHPDMIHAPLMRHGKLMYQCTLAAMTQFEGQFEGYLFMGDDVLLNTSYISTLDTSAMWIEPTAINLSTSDMTKDGGWFKVWARKKPGGAESAVLLEANSSLASEDLAQLKDTGWVHAKCDAYYFPASAAAAIRYLAPIFLHHEIYFSNAIPTMMQLIRRRGVRIQHWHGLYKWPFHNDRFWWQKHLPKVVGKAYYHPFKLTRFDRSNRNDLALACKFAYSTSVPGW